MTPLRLVFVEPKGGGKIQDGVTVTPTKEEQTVEPDPGFDGLGAVTVEAIPDAFQDVTGVNAGAEDIRVGKVGIDAQGNLLNGEMLPRKPEQEKSVIPTKQAQTVSPDPGYALFAVNVAKIPDAYQDVSFVDAGAADIRIGKTGISAIGERLDGQMLPQKPEQVKSATPTTSPQSVTPDTGYALSRVDVDAIPSEYADVSDVTATAGTVLTGSDFVDASGALVHGACDYDADTSDADATAGQIEAGATAYVGGAKVTGTMPVRTTDVEISDLSPVPIPAGSYDGTTSAKLSSAAAAEVVAANIRQGAEILGVQGSYEGADTLEQLNGDTLTSYSNSTATNVRKYLFYQNTELKNIMFPNAVSIGEYAFYQAKGLTSVSFPAVETIGERAFTECPYIASVDVPSCTFVYTRAFFSCPHLASCSMPNVKTISTECFSNCAALTALNLPSCTSFGASAAQNCKQLQSVSLQIAVDIGGSAFRNCTSLVNVHLPAFRTAAERSIFSGCSSLQRITLPSLIDTKDAIEMGIGGMFGNCTSLEEVDFGSLTRLGDRCFRACSSLTKLIIRSSTVSNLSNVNAFDLSPFSADGSGGTLYVPQAQIANYQSATNWSVILAYPYNLILPIEGSPYEVTT